VFVLLGLAEPAREGGDDRRRDGRWLWHDWRGRFAVGVGEENRSEEDASRARGRGPCLGRGDERWGRREEEGASQGGNRAAGRRRRRRRVAAVPLRCGSRFVGCWDAGLTRRRPVPPHPIPPASVSLFQISGQNSKGEP
jgi:hypothetical protein